METPSPITEKEISTYLSEIRHQLSLTHSVQETASIMKMIENSIDDFLSEHPAATISDLKKHFGDIDDLKEMFFSCTDSEQLETHLNQSCKKRKLLKCFLLFLTLILLTCSTFYIKSCIDLDKSIPAYEIIKIE